jgi:hypothetical protein
MDAMQERNTAEQARHDVAAHPERSGRHEDRMRRYLGAVLYDETRPERAGVPRRPPGWKPAWI